MKPKRRIRRPAFLALALMIAISLPLTASARESGTAGDAALYLSRVYSETDRGEPASGTTRAQYIQILYRAAGAPEVSGVTQFVDVDHQSDYAGALLWAERAGVAKADRDGRFNPDGIVSRQDAADFLQNALAALGQSAQKVANSILAAYTGRPDEEAFALTPAALVALLGEMQTSESDVKTQPDSVLAAPGLLSSGA